MYKLLIVDDEEIECEGMAQFIPWKNYDIELVGTAWNGVDGFEKIQTCHPDIVLTDIKMPVMNGIELIKKTRKSFPEVEFIVLSGYGEYEFTSQAMEEGVRHYILKPCDEEKIVEVIEKVKAGILKKQQQKEESSQYHDTVRRLLPRAKEQIFRNMLLDREQIQREYQLFLAELESEEQQVRVLSMRFENKIDYLEQFCLENIVGELLGEKNIILSASIQNEVLFLIKAEKMEAVEAMLDRTKVEMKRITSFSITAALSEQGSLHEVNTLYLQIEELFRIGSLEHGDKLLHYELFREMQGKSSRLVDYSRLGSITEYNDILFELHLAFIKMELENYMIKQKEEVCRWIFKVLYGEEVSFSYRSVGKEQAWELFEQTAEGIIKRKQTKEVQTKEDLRVRSILMSTYKNLQNPEMSIQYLAKEVLYMNEDYFGRIFVKNQKVKFSTFLLELRIELAKRLLTYNSDMKISELAELVGYPADGQYFSKAFKKVAEMSPTEYRDMVK
ncbi:response regulator transcription factor [Konateibacter massiliensis]|uniref:response regulator transcription factor n=1 Tax=Konateibacter massiliensis TaxID=2002841 RepID=UPI000C14CEDE|nr:response regulator [Konateibacter massiliensis]